MCCKVCADVCYIGTIYIFTTPVVGKNTEMTDEQTGMEIQKRTFTDAVKKGRIPHDLLSKVPVEQLKEVYGKELNSLGIASWPPEAHNPVKL